VSDLREGVTLGEVRAAARARLLVYLEGEASEGDLSQATLALNVLMHDLNED